MADYKFTAKRRTRLYTDKEVRRINARRKAIRKIINRLAFILIPAPIIIWGVLWLFFGIDTITTMTFWGPFLTYFGTVMLGLIAFRQNRKLLEMNENIRKQQHIENKPILCLEGRKISKNLVEFILGNYGGVAFDSVLTIFEDKKTIDVLDVGVIVNTTDHPDAKIRFKEMVNENFDYSFSITFKMSSCDVDTIEINYSEELLGKRAIKASEIDFDWLFS